MCLIVDADPFEIAVTMTPKSSRFLIIQNGRVHVPWFQHAYLVCADMHTAK